MPRISIAHLGTSRDEIGLGDEGSRFISVFEIGVWTNSRISATIEGDVKKGSELREHIGDKIVKAFIDNRRYLLDTYGFLDARLIGTTLIAYDPSNDLYRKLLTVEVTWDASRSQV